MVNPLYSSHVWEKKDRCDIIKSSCPFKLKSSILHSITYWDRFWQYLLDLRMLTYSFVSKWLLVKTLYLSRVWQEKDRCDNNKSPCQIKLKSSILYSITYWDRFGQYLLDFTIITYLFVSKWLLVQTLNSSPVWQKKDRCDQYKSAF